MKRLIASTVIEKQRATKNTALIRAPTTFDKMFLKIKVSKTKKPQREPNQKCSVSTPWGWCWRWRRRSARRWRRSACGSCRRRGPCCWWCCPPPAQWSCTSLSWPACRASGVSNHTWRTLKVGKTATHQRCILSKRSEWYLFSGWSYRDFFFSMIKQSFGIQGS